MALGRPCPPPAAARPRHRPSRASQSQPAPRRRARPPPPAQVPCPRRPPERARGGASTRHARGCGRRVSCEPFGAHAGPGRARRAARHGAAPHQLPQLVADRRRACASEPRQTRECATDARRQEPRAGGAKPRREGPAGLRHHGRPRHGLLRLLLLLRAVCAVRPTATRARAAGRGRLRARGKTGGARRHGGVARAAGQNSAVRVAHAARAALVRAHAVRRERLRHTRRDSAHARVRLCLRLVGVAKEGVGECLRAAHGRAQPGPAPEPGGVRGHA